VTNSSTTILLFSQLPSKLPQFYCSTTNAFVGCGGVGGDSKNTRIVVAVVSWWEKQWNCKGEGNKIVEEEAEEEEGR